MKRVIGKNTDIEDYEEKECFIYLARYIVSMGRKSGSLKRDVIEKLKDQLKDCVDKEYGYKYLKYYI